MHPLFESLPPSTSMPFVLARGTAKQVGFGRESKCSTAQMYHTDFCDEINFRTHHQTSVYSRWQQSQRQSGPVPQAGRAHP